MGYKLVVKHQLLIDYISLNASSSVSRSTGQRKHLMCKLQLFLNRINNFTLKLPNLCFKIETACKNVLKKTKEGWKWRIWVWKMLFCSFMAHMGHGQMVEHPNGRTKKHGLRWSGWEQADALAPNALTADGHFQGITFGPLTLAIQTAWAEDLNHSKGKSWTSASAF